MIKYNVSVICYKMSNVLLILKFKHNLPWIPTEAKDTYSFGKNLVNSSEISDI